MAVDIVERLQADFSLLHNQIVDNRHTDDRPLNLGCHGDETAEVIHDPSPDGEDADIDHGKENQQLIAHFGQAGLDDHAVYIRSSPLCADIGKSNHQQAEE